MTSRPPLHESVRRVGVIAWSLVGTLILLGLVAWAIARVSNVIPALVLAVALIYVLNPVVSRLARHGVPRLLGSCLSYVVLIGLLTLAGWLAIPSIADQARGLADDFPTIYDDLAIDLERLADRIGISVDIPAYEEVSEDFGSATDDGGFLSLDRLGNLTLGVLELVLVLVLAPVIAFYILLDLPKLQEKGTGLIPQRHRAEVHHVAEQVSKAVGGFLRGQLLVALIVGIMTSIGFLLIDLQFWLLIGMIAGFLNIVPFVGPWVGGTLGVLVALATGDATQAIWAAVVAAGVQQIDNHFISPTVLRFTVKLHPATIIVALLVGGSIGGLLGVLLAVPVVAAVKIVAGHFWRTRVLGQSWQEASAEMIEEHPTMERRMPRFRALEEPQWTAEGGPVDRSIGEE